MSILWTAEEENTGLYADNLLAEAPSKTAYMIQVQLRAVYRNALGHRHILRQDNKKRTFSKIEFMYLAASLPPWRQESHPRFCSTADVKLLRENCSNVKVNLTESFCNHKQHNHLQVKETHYWGTKIDVFPSMANIPSNLKEKEQT